MQWIDEVVRKFGQTMGLQLPSLTAAGQVSLDFEKKGQFFLELTEDGVLLYLARPFPAYQRDVALRALTQCHYRSQGPQTFYPAMRKGDTLVYLTHVSFREFNLPLIERSLSQLDRMLRKTLAA
ncbi:hypothetical protein [Acanthopleuribacter pedis]|uniref:Type III secretion chaperone SycN n=1 Tax=Acanthopleuribacter pedis TaxID=442870 RepID=A0A8J7QF84_9BACT|nr:hypothetical protein [Acanthopleuribacter pedis]MBO1322969.1 hypothetical protein [Acanthopleuribacter pedis]